ncbi:FtsX-like permease family protein [Spirosoma endbachense]|uniref:FtsX-like permease family protein n=2 Tax=Spirosoma endbachense TaxID=2666025 RepID=A0A6P1WCD8_9BACT|nr:FtsX-like permease family protein [Spirosoma endbachense]
MFSFINVMGLSVGMTACFLIALYVHFELTYDAFHQKADRIYRLATDLKTESETIQYDISSWAYAPNLKQDFPEVENFVRISTKGRIVRKGDLKFQEDKTVFADSSFFSVFNFKLLKGDSRTALAEPMSVVLPQKTVRKYFGDADPMGQTLLLGDDGVPAKITGIMEDIPENSQIKGDLFISMISYTDYFNKGIENEWGDFGAISFLLLKPGANPDALAKKFPQFLESHAGKMMREYKLGITLVLEPLREVYLYSKRPAEESGSVTNVTVFSVIGLFILLLACINFSNLTTARSADRAKEVGVRKAIGAARWLLARQFIGESVLLCLVAFLVAVLLSAVLIPGFNTLAGKTISPGIGSNLPFVGGMFIAASAIGCLAGTYPALVLSSFEPVTVLKGRFMANATGIFVRKGLVTLQFAISITLVIATIVIYSQVDFMRTRDLGFSKDQMLVIKAQAGTKRNVFDAAISRMSGVKSTAASSSVPGGWNPQAASSLENNSGDMQAGNLDVYRVDFDFISQYNLKVVAGRPFSRNFPADSSQSLMINEAMAKVLGYSRPQAAIGKRFDQWGRKGTIVGVLKDFHFKSLQETIKPLTFRVTDWWNGDLLSVKIDGRQVRQTLEAIEAQWKQHNPDRPFDYYFMDEFFDRQYRSDERFQTLFVNFALLAIFISCLGLLGLASYTTVQRTKEIGVRKVLGASTGSIVGLLSKDFLKLVVLAFLIASPLAWYGMHRWLENFAYQTPIRWWVFGSAGVLSVTVAFVTISFQSIRAALLNPVKSLRSE